MAASAQEEFDELMRDKDKRGNHPEDDEQQLQQSKTEESPIPPQTAMPRSSMSSSRDQIPRARYGANTGPKGVIADAQDFRHQQRMYRRAGQMAQVSGVPEVEEKAGPTFGQRERLDMVEQAESDGNELAEDIDVDDEFIKQWRLEKMQQFRSGGGMAQRQDENTYYGLASVDGEGYLDAVEHSGPNTVVAVYIYDDMSQVSNLFESCLRTLSHKHETTRFVKLHFADAEMEPAGVPAIIAYRGGDKFAALVPIIDEMPDDGDLDALTLETVLKRHQILT